MGLRSVYVSFRRRQIYGRCLAVPSRLVILRYHSVGEPRNVGEYLDPALSITPERFREQIKFLAGAFDIVSPGRIAEFAARERPRRPAAAITFDDGYRDNHDVAMTILREEGVEAAFYVTTAPLTSGRGLWISELWRLVPRLPAGPLDLAAHLPREVPADDAGRRILRRRITRWFASLTAGERESVLDRLASLAGVPRGEGLERSFMTPEHVRGLAGAGMTVGAHSRTHPHLDHLEPSHHADEVRGSRDDLEAILSTSVEHFAYPNPSGGGRFGDEARASVESAGFATAMTSTPNPMPARPDPLRLPRLGVYAGAQERTLFRVLARAAR